jgi:hypothetical protein
MGVRLQKVPGYDVLRVLLDSSGLQPAGAS